ncbi:uncharacterized protein An16g07250 [Aspergillus niger]|uniref:Contig An16c0230, genomic contig n=2 Tax=Aspergillus niger TaxID=5061 RepID=A2R8I3_ASPNC|nr:uncharacterized protein An16g07250 [Aspergillus niger]CAL00498.1 unnamed protein product [Aspergillus niger]
MEIVSSWPMRDVALSRARMIGLAPSEGWWAIRCSQVRECPGVWEGGWWCSTISSFGHHLSQIQNTEEPRESPSSPGPGRMDGPVVQVPTHLHDCAGPQVPINRFAFPDVITVGRDRKGNRLPEFGLLRDKRLAERDRHTERHRDGQAHGLTEVSTVSDGGVVLSGMIESIGSRYPICGPTRNTNHGSDTDYSAPTTEYYLQTSKLTILAWKLMVPTATDLLSTTPVSNPLPTRRPALTGKGSIYENRKAYLVTKVVNSK